MKIGLVLVGIWFIVTGLTALVRINIPSREAVMGVLALVAGIFLLLQR